MTQHHYSRKLLLDYELQQICNLLSSTVETDWMDGLHSVSNSNENTKQLKQLTQLNNYQINSNINSIIINALERDGGFDLLVCPKTTGFIMITKMKMGDYYRLHHDLGLNGHYSTTVFLSDPDTYEGGELVLHNDFGPHKIKLDAGEAITYDTGILHEVSTVESGERLAAVFWTTSRFSDPFLRSIHYKVNESLRVLHRTESNEYITEAIFNLNQISHDLLRRTL